MVVGAKSESYAQVSPQQNQSGYHAALLDELTISAEFSNKSYIVREEKEPIQLQEMIEKVRQGSVLPYLNHDAYIDMGQSGRGVWIVLPISNKGTQDVWTLDLGSFGKGRFSNFKDIMIYNLTTGKYVVNTQDTDRVSQSLPSSIQITVPSQQTSFYLLYLKPNIGSLLYVHPVLKLPNQMSYSQVISLWLSIVMGFGAFLYFIKTAKDNAARSHLYIAFIWLGVSAQLFVSKNFLYIGGFQTEILSPFVWLFLSLMMTLSLTSIKDCRDKLPISLLGGVVTTFLMCGLAGLIVLEIVPALSIVLIYAPVLLASMLVAGLCGLFVFKEKRQSYIPLGCVSVSIGLTIVWIGFLYLQILPETAFTLMVPEVLVVIGILMSVIGTMIPEIYGESHDDDAITDVFSENQISKNEISKIQEAKEQSEHRRLIRVIEQERKLMSELQLRTAQQNEDMRHAKDAADEANRAKSAFLAIVSHEIRTPMTGIMGMLRLLQDTQLSKDQKEYTTTMKDSGDAMLALLNDILDFEKIESGKMDLENISFDLKRLIKGVHTLMRGHAEAKNIGIELEMDSNTPTWVRGDPTRLRQVLLNLINNAIKFTNKGVVSIRVRDLTGESIDGIKTTHQIYFAVQDSGIGISSEGQKKLFMPFAQADSSISRKYGGTGLGLAICKRLIDAMGGAISINSKDGEGSTFFFTLSMPSGSEIQEGQSDYQSNTMPVVKLTTPVNVLIVDDNGINQKVVAGFIDKIGGDSMTANSGADALDMVSRHQFDLILMDLQLPDMNGIEVTKKIRALPIQGKAATPIVALTGNTDGEDRQACFDAGMNDFATKPITLEKVSEILGKISNHAYSHSAQAGQIDFGYINDNPVNLAEQGADHGVSSMDMGFLGGEGDLDLDEDEEDSFALAVRKFEEMERSGMAYSPSSAPLGEASLSDVGLDEDILKSLRSGLSVEQIQEILVSFYEKADELIADIGKSYLDGDVLSLYARAHELKGMAGNFGFSGLSKMCATIEKASKDKQLDIAKEPIDHLGDSYAVARAVLNKWLANK